MSDRSSERDRDRKPERERDRGTSTDRDRRRTREHLEDDLDLIRGAPREKAWRILNNLLEAVYGEGFIRGVEDVRGMAAVGGAPRAAAAAAAADPSD